MYFKKQVGIEAAKRVETGMVLGLGTGSTAVFFVEELARRIREEDLSIKAVTTSTVTAELAESLGMKISSIDEISSIDLTVDGVDEFDPELNGIKGGGGALLMEKIVANLSKDYIWIADESKKVKQLGSFPLPVEVVPFGSAHLFQKFQDKGYEPSFRLDALGKKFLTDQQHFIIDLTLDRIENAEELASELDKTIGVVEHGLFLNMVKTVIVSGNSGLETFEKGKQK